MGISEDERRLCLVSFGPDAGWNCAAGPRFRFRREALPVAWQPEAGGVLRCVRTWTLSDGGQVTLMVTGTPCAATAPTRGADGKITDGGSHAVPALAAHAFSALIVFAMIQIGFSDAAREHMRGAAEHVCVLERSNECRRIFAGKSLTSV